MPRPRLIPDALIFSAIRSLLAAGGEKAVAFSSVARATGLAAPTLVQRYKSRDLMLRAALDAGWDALEASTTAAEAEAEMSAKGALALLKALGEVDIALLAADFRHARLRQRAADWRARVETALALRLGGGAKGRETAAALFALWQGQAMWNDAGGKTFRLKEAVKRLI
ncbi:transcriptional regulator [Fertoebacter nigrum]|uniref:Transcriptional regulator n=1 Tax=Fertoeibacter niger TaxID=2656921 RepID=A0A8X8KQV4_9RHOB|nr:transcriptional regulator [Fertoeibacter niger]NUB46650.1 transcriptional regulator [Fertoeibacter niger]